jgi:hypothetical protein
MYCPMVSGDTFVPFADCAIHGSRDDADALDWPSAKVIAQRPRA